jgi:hypothetical protein
MASSISRQPRPINNRRADVKEVNTVPKKPKKEEGKLEIKKGKEKER